MNKTARMISTGLVLAALFPFCFAGCAVDASSEEGPVGTAAEASCMDYSDGIIYGSGSWTSPTTYGHSDCLKGNTVQVSNLSVSPTTWPAGVYVDWADTVPTTQTACQELTITTQQYHYNTLTSTWGSVGVPHTAHGTWISGGGLTYCAGPQWIYDFADGFVSNGEWYRFSVSATWTDGTTRKFTVATQAGVQ